MNSTTSVSRAIRSKLSSRPQVDPTSMRAIRGLLSAPPPLEPHDKSDGPSSRRHSRQRSIGCLSNRCRPRSSSRCLPGWFDLGSGGGSPAIPLEDRASALKLTMVESRSQESGIFAGSRACAGTYDAESVECESKSWLGLTRLARRSADRARCENRRRLSDDCPQPSEARWAAAAVRFRVRACVKRLIFAPIDEFSLAGGDSTASSTHAGSQ